MQRGSSYAERLVYRFLQIYTLPFYLGFGALRSIHFI